MRRIGIATLLVLTATLLIPRHAEAQGPGDTNIFGGYSFLHVNDTDELLSNFPGGFEVGITHRLNGRMLSVGGKFQFNATSLGNAFGTTSSADFAISEALFGVLFGPPADAAKRFWVFGMVHVGTTRSSVQFLGESDSETDFTVQPGAGMGVFLTPNLGLQVTAEVPITRSDGSFGTGFRFGASMSVRLR